MSTHTKSSLRPMSQSDRHTEEVAAAMAFLNSNYVEEFLRNTFSDVAYEYEELDGLLRPTTPTPPRTKPSSPPSEHVSVWTEPNSPLEPLFSPEEYTILTTSFGNDWVNMSPSSNRPPRGPNRPACSLHRRKFSRSPRISLFNSTFSETEDIDPFMSAFSEQEGSNPQETDFVAPFVRSRLGAFTLLELPEVRVGGDCTSEDRDLPVATTGPPPGLPSPRPRFQPLGDHTSSPTPG